MLTFFHTAQLKIHLGCLEEDNFEEGLTNALIAAGINAKDIIAI
jgi:hypothetical protein